MSDVSIIDCGAVGGGANDTAAIQQAIDAAETANKTVYVPGGVFETSNLVLRPGTRFGGDHATKSTIKCRVGTTGTFVATTTADDPDIVIKDISFDGNWPNVAACDGLDIRGSRQTIQNVTIINAAGAALRTSYVVNDRRYSILGHFDHITIDKAKGGGWLHAGPTDSYASNIEIVDASLGTDAGAYGFHASGNGTINADNMHIWNRTTGNRENRPAAAAYLVNGGHKFSNSNFEGGAYGGLIVLGSYNCFKNCSTFAPDGTVGVIFGGSFNQYSGLVGGGADYFYPDYLGMVLGLSPSQKSEGNIIEVQDAGCNLGAIDFTNSGGKNIVRVRGWKPAGKPSYSGSPHAKDEVDIYTSGPGGVRYRKIAA